MQISTAALATRCRRVHARHGLAPRLLAVGTAISLCLAAGVGHGQSTPSGQARIIRLVVPFAAGSNTDAVTRMISPGMGERLGATIVIENRAGANGIIGAEVVAKSAPDGLSYLVGSASVNAVNPALYKTLPYDPARDLVPVARIGFAPLMVLAHPSLPFDNVAGMIDYAKKNPRKLAYGSPSSITMVAMETLKRMADIDILNVPYKSSPQAMTDLVGNQLQVMVSDFNTAVPLVKAGRVKVLAVTMAKRSQLLQNIPPVDDVLKGYDITAWTAFFAPRGTPADAIAKVAAAMEATLATKEIQERLGTIGFDIAPQGPDVFARYVPEQIAIWRRLIRESGIQPE